MTKEQQSCMLYAMHVSSFRVLHIYEPNAVCSYNVWAHWEVAPPRAHLIGNWMSGSILGVFK